MRRAVVGFVFVFLLLSSARVTLGEVPAQTQVDLPVWHANLYRGQGDNRVLMSSFESPLERLSYYFSPGESTVWEALESEVSVPLANGQYAFLQINARCAYTELRVNGEVIRGLGEITNLEFEPNQELSIFFLC